MSETRRVAVIGAGPIGLEAALYARALGFDVSLYDRGDVADNVRKWGFVRLFTPWRMNLTSLGRAALRESGVWEEPPADQCPTGRELRERYLKPLANSGQLRDSLHLNTRIITIGRDELATSKSPFRILAADASGRERIDQSDVILDCTGTYGNHRWAGRGGIPAPGEAALASRIWYTIPDLLGHHRERFANRHTLVLGCGHSAATVLEAFEQLHAQSPGTRVSWAIRRPGQALQAMHGDTLSQRRELVVKALQLAEHPPDWLHFFGTCVLEELWPSGDKLSPTLRSMDKKSVLQVDEIAALVGYGPDASIHEQLPFDPSYATGAGAATNPHPGFFILGAKSYGTSSNFLIEIGHRQIVDAFRLLKNDPKLNLYER